MSASPLPFARRATRVAGVVVSVPRGRDLWPRPVKDEEENKKEGRSGTCEAHQTPSCLSKGTIGTDKLFH